MFFDSVIKPGVHYATHKSTQLSFGDKFTLWIFYEAFTTVKAVDFVLLRYGNRHPEGIRSYVYANGNKPGLGLTLAPQRQPVVTCFTSVLLHVQNKQVAVKHAQSASSRRLIQKQKYVQQMF